MNLKNRVYPDLKQTIDSLMPLNSDIIALSDGHSNDDILDNCGVDVIHGSQEDFSSLRNKIIDNCETEWNIYINPWEILSSHSKILWAMESEKNIYNLMILNNEIITKEARLWKKGVAKFVNPIYSTLEFNDKSKNLDCMIKTNNVISDNSKDKTYDILSSWIKQRPTSPRPYYYEAFYHLEKGNFDDFIKSSKEYLGRENKNNMSTVMLKYYCSMVYCYKIKNTKEAVSHILGCLSVKPLMAEYWCLLGDIYYTLMKDYYKAKIMYDNARILGERRPMDDDWPIEMSKYRKYPLQMITNCIDLYNLSKMYY